MLRKLWKKLTEFWEREGLTHDRSMTARIFAGYSPTKREAELKRLVEKWLPNKYIHSNSNQSLMGPDWNRVKFPSGNPE